MEGCRKDGECRDGRDGALFKGVMCMELCLGIDDEPVPSLWVRMRGQTTTGDATLGICHIPSDKEEQVKHSLGSWRKS